MLTKVVGNKHTHGRPVAFQLHLTGYIMSDHYLTHNILITYWSSWLSRFDVKSEEKKKHIGPLKFAVYTSPQPCSAKGERIGPFIANHVIPMRQTHTQTHIKKNKKNKKAWK